MLNVVPEPASGDDRQPGGSSLIDEIVREGARRMLAEALQAEVDTYVAQFADERDEHGYRLVVRNGSHQPREVLTNPIVSRPSPPSDSASGSPRDPAPAPQASPWPSSSSSPHKLAGARNAPHLVALVRAGARFENGQLLERPDKSGGDQQAA
jgi:hypothetical protein